MAIPAHYARDCRVSCAHAYRMRVCTCYARIIVARFFGGGGCPLWARFSPPFWVGFSACFGGILWGLFWGGGVGGCSGRTRTATATAKRRTGARAHGSRLAGVRLLAVGVRVGVGVRPSNLIFLALIIFAVWWGVFYSQTATEKRRTVCVRSLSLPRPFFRTPNTSVR